MTKEEKIKVPWTLTWDKKIIPTQLFINKHLEIIRVDNGIDFKKHMSESLGVIYKNHIVDFDNNIIGSYKNEKAVFYN